jgi:hypothetical protein
MLALACIFTFAAGRSNAQSNTQQSKTRLIEALETAPSPANSLAFLHVPSLRRLIDEAGMQATPLADELEEVWQIAQLDPISLKPQWEAGFAVLKRQIDADALAKGLNGYVDEVAGEQVVWTPRESYLLPREGRIGFLRPADRTLLSNWITSETSRKPAEFLVQQAGQPEEYLSFMLAIELENAISPVPLKAKIQNFESLKNVDINAVTTVLASTKGVSIIIGRKSLEQCILEVDFGIAPTTLEPIARELLDEMLKANGTAAPEVLTWDVKVEGNKLKYQGAISEGSLDGLLSVLSVRGHAEQAAAAASQREVADNSTPGEPTAYDTKKYFDRMLGLIERTEKYNAQSTGYRAKWNDLNARRMDELPTLGVDPEMVGYGANVSSLLRNNAAAIRGVNVSTGQTQAAQGLSRGAYVDYGGSYGGYYGGGYYGRGYGYVDMNSTVDYQRVAGAQARMAGYGSFKATMTQIDQMTGDIRRKMTEKYNTQF